MSAHFALQSPPARGTRPLTVIRARAMGFCFGVADALEAARSLDRPEEVTIWGELVHNPTVTGDLERRGFHTVPEAGRESPPPTPVVLVTAHGISQRERDALLAAGKRLVDTTCPLVRRAHDAARRLAAAGHLVLVLGRRGHVEVRGLVGDLERYEIVESERDVRRFDAERLGIVCQTTTQPREAERLVAAIRGANPQAVVRFEDTICRPTRERQEAIEELLGQVEALVVVGGPRSNNTRQLARRALEAGVPALHVATADELDPDWLAPYSVVGLTAGTSTPDECVEAVEERLRAL